MEALVPLVIQLLSGAVGGNIVGKIFNNLSLGTAGNSIAGIVGGGLGGQLLGLADGAGGLGGIISQIAGGGVGGGVLMLIIGMIKRVLSK